MAEKFGASLIQRACGSIPLRIYKKYVLHDRLLFPYQFNMIQCYMDCPVPIDNAAASFQIHGINLCALD